MLVCISINIWSCILNKRTISCIIDDSKRSKIYYCNIAVVLHQLTSNYIRVYKLYSVKLSLLVYQCMYVLYLSTFNVALLVNTFLTFKNVYLCRDKHFLK